MQILDNSGTAFFSAVDDVEIQYQWGITGTLVRNSLDDIWSYFRFFRVEHWGTEENFEAVRLAPSLSSILLY
jgi:hypothetical protein